jgi:hypothetical protein
MEVRDFLVLDGYSNIVFRICTPAKNVKLILVQENQEGHREIPGF